MEYVQEAVTTLHDFDGAVPEAPADRVAVVVPLTEREHADPAVERVFSALERVAPQRVVVPLRASPSRVDDVSAWLDAFEVSIEVVWCDGPRLEALLYDAGLDGPRGKGRDVWLALGIASQSDYVVVHDADAKRYDERHVQKLLFPLIHGHEFSKGYYARIENDRLYGRLFRLFYRPIVAAMARRDDAAILEYLDAFRYALAGEFAMTRELARRVRMQRGWGLEIGTLGEVFDLVGSDASAQVDLGVHEHDHRTVTGPSGLSQMAEQVADALFRVVEDNGYTPKYGTLRRRYRAESERLIDDYELDAAFNDLEYDRIDELRQVDAYAGAIQPPGEDIRLPAWQEIAVTPEAVREAAAADLDAAGSADPGAIDTTLDGS